MSTNSKGSNSEESRKTTLNQVSLTFFLFSVVCLITAISMESSIDEQKYTLPPKGQLIGPLTVSDNSAVYEFELTQKVKLNDWSYVTLELLDKDQNYLYGFGKELWDEAGRDSEGYWHESDYSFKTKCTISKKGQYYFNVYSENYEEAEASGISMWVRQQRGSSLGFYWLAVFGVILAIIINEINRRTIINMMLQ